MRLDKYLKVSRLIKRRTIANEACDTGRISVNGKVQKASYDVKIGDVIGIRFGEYERMKLKSYSSIYEEARKKEKRNVWKRSYHFRTGSGGSSPCYCDFCQREYATGTE